MASDLCDFAVKLEKAGIDTVESGVMTKDLIPFADPRPEKHVLTEAFIEEIGKRLDALV